MFSFRRDKVGFFVTLILIVIAAGTLINTLVLVVVGLAMGNWTMFSVPMKIVLAAAWVLCIVVVYTRVAIYRAQMVSAEKARARAEAEANGHTNDKGQILPLPPPGEPGASASGFASSSGGAREESGG
jgi:hypothetical protein